VISQAVKTYAEEVRRGSFPDETHSYHQTRKKRQ